VRRLREESAGTGRKARYEFPVPSRESALPNGGLLAIAIGLGMVVYGTWYTMSAADQNPLELIQEVPARLAVLLDDQSIEQIQEERLGQVAAPGKLVAAEIIEISAPNSAPSVAMSDSEESETGAVDEDLSLDPQVAELALSGIGQGGHEDLIIELRAKSDSWIQVRDGDDLLLTRLLRQGEVYTVPDRNGLTLTTSNAGGLEVFVDGELMPPLGDVGVVHRGVPLSADRLRTGIEPG
jgi:cytoskeleton protein RodZ